MVIFEKYITTGVAPALQDGCYFCAEHCFMTDFPVLQSTWIQPPRMEVPPQ